MFSKTSWEAKEEEGKAKSLQHTQMDITDGSFLTTSANQLGPGHVQVQGRKLKTLDVYKHPRTRHIITF